jgi:alpha-amylase
VTSVVFYFQVHQPFRLRRFTFFDIGARHDYFDDESNAFILRRVAERCYRPMNDLLLEAIEASVGRFRCAFSLSGTVLDQLERWSPETLESFRRLAATGAVEFLGETSHHSLAALFDPEEMAWQVRSHAARIERLFGTRPTTFRNTELVCSNAVARQAEELGFSCILGEGADHLLGWRSPHHLYRPEGCERIKLLLRSYSLSDDIAFRFSNRGWSEWPLTADRFARWVAGVKPPDEVVGLFMDYETFGEHQWAETGIFAFMERLPHELLARGVAFATPSEAAALDPVGRLDVPHPVSWADAERDLTAWLGNDMQRAANEALWDLGREVRRRGDESLLADWRRLTTSDHVYYMCTKWFSDGDVHKYFSPFETPHDAFVAFMNVIDDLDQRLRASRGTPPGAVAPRPRPKGRRATARVRGKSARERDARPGGARRRDA